MREQLEEFLKELITDGYSIEDISNAVECYEVVNAGEVDNISK